MTRRWVVLLLVGVGAVWAALNAWASEGTPVPASGGGSEPSSEVVSEAAEALLKQRVVDRWQALIKGDFEAAYQFETPAYRAVYTPLQFKYQFGNQIAWRVANVESIRYADPDVAKVTVSVAYRYEESEKKENRKVENSAQLNEVWLRKGGQWWHQRQD